MGAATLKQLTAEDFNGLEVRDQQGRVLGRTSNAKLDGVSVSCDIELTLVKTTLEYERIEE